MKIPDSFRPKGELDDRIQGLLERKISFDHVEVSIHKKVYEGRIKHFSHFYRKFEAKFTDDLRILFEYNVGHVAVVDVRILESAFERKTDAYSVGSLKTGEHSLVADTARKKIEAKEKNFNLNKLKEQIENDFELLKKLDGLFVDLPFGDYHFLIRRNGVVSKLMTPGLESFSLGGRFRLERIYSEHIKKYLPSTY